MLGTRRRWTGVVGFLGLALGAGALSGVLWWLVVDLPAYLVQPDGKAATSERGLADFVAADAWFTLLGGLVGALLGWLAWARLRLLGWPVVVVAIGAALASALVCWFVGHQLGPSELNPRLVGARPGDSVLIELTLRSTSALLVWPFAAVVPVLLGSSLGVDEEEPPAPRREPGRLTAQLRRLVRSRSRSGSSRR